MIGAEHVTRVEVGMSVATVARGDDEPSVGLPRQSLDPGQEDSAFRGQVNPFKRLFG
jgi:hypothetical protein